MASQQRTTLPPTRCRADDILQQGDAKAEDAIGFTGLSMASVKRPSPGTFGKGTMTSYPSYK